jgi:hypothetical protein
LDGNCFDILTFWFRCGLYRGKKSAILKDRVFFCGSSEEKAQLVSRLGGFVAIVDVDWNSLISASKVRPIFALRQVCGGGNFRAAASGANLERRSNDVR